MGGAILTMRNGSKIYGSVKLEPHLLWDTLLLLPHYFWMAHHIA
jgi:hypothetical protein